jgi:hypothetical protein
MSTDDPSTGGVTRLSFMKVSAGAAAGAAAVGVPAAVVLAGESRGVQIDPATAPKADAVMAYVRDETRGEVTIVAGTSEMTYRDPALVKRLLAAAPKSGGADVLAS